MQVRRLRFDVTDPPRMTMKLLDRDGTPLATVADVVDKALADPEFFPCKFQKLVRRAARASAKKGVRGDATRAGRRGRAKSTWSSIMPRRPSC